MKTIEISIYSFDELSDEAKERAREWYRDGALDYEWWDSIYEDFERICEILGIELNRRKQANPAARGGPCIYFEGFGHQGQGASFEGTYRFHENAGRAIREYAPQDTTLHAIADSLDDLQTRNGGGLYARISASPRGHWLSVDVDCDMPDDSDEFEMSGDAEEGIAEAMRDLAHWLFRTLEAECEYFDEQVDESILANGYEFTKEGEIA